MTVSANRFSICRAAVTAVLLLGTASTCAFAQVPTTGRWLGLQFGIRVTGVGATTDGLQGVPAALRTVPTHRDDGTVRSIAIPESPLRLGEITAVGLEAGPSFHIGRHRIDAGVTFNYVTNARALRPDSTAEWNYQGSGRTVGAALVYYALTAQTGWSRPGISLDYGLGLNRHLELLAGYARERMGVVLQSGWDRYNAAQPRTNMTLTEGRLETPYLGVGTHGLRVTVGPTRHHATWTDAGRSVDLGIRRSTWRLVVEARAHI